MFLKVECNRRGIDRLSGIAHRKFNHVEFIQTMTGGGNVLVDSHILPMRYGAVYIFYADKPHCTAPADPKTYVRNCVTVDKPCFDSIITATGADEILTGLKENGVYHTELSTMGIQLTSKKFEELGELSKSGASQVDISLCILELLVILRDNSVSNGNDNELHSHIELALNFINSNYSQGIGTKEVADYLHLSKPYLCRLFKKHTGMTLTDYLLEKRLSVANDLLTEKSLSVCKVAAQLGFSSESYFIAKYKERYGITPGKKTNNKKVVT